jgi:3-deoxy-manno-octulosonate cytidylyltransferase (CMP-KDO synthetase)
MKVVGIIPARYGSTRLAGKPLMDICGKPMIQHVYENIQQASLLEDLIVATDDQRIVDVVSGFGGKAQLTSVQHQTGTDRIAEVAKSLDAEIIVNIQGDEPLLDARMIDEIIFPMLEVDSLPACTLCVAIHEDEKLNSPHIVKSVFDLQGRGLYFSRSLIPFPRKKETFRAYEHIGIYAYRKDFLMQYIALAQTPLELTESLEQMRIIENGYRLQCVITQYEYAGLGVDTPESLEQVRAIFAQRIAANGSPA